MERGPATGRIRFRDKVFAPGSQLVMAIVNRTTDSFYDHGATWDRDRAFARVDEVVAHGADILDIGGVKAGPGATVDEDEEIARTIDFIAAVRDRHPGW